MKRAVFSAPHKVGLTEKARPKADSDSVLVAVRACGLCTWEQRVYRGSKPQYPFAGGHEVGGVVEDAPGGQFVPGTTVAVSCLPRCGTCARCKNGKDNLCAYGTLPMSEPGEPEGPGGLAEYLLASAGDVVPVQGCNYDEAALVEPLACVLNSLDAAEVERNTRLAIIGNGFMGVLHARAAKAFGADVTLLRTDPAPEGLKRAWLGNSLDADDPTESSAFDAVILIRDVVAKLPLAGDMARPGGIVSVFASLLPAAEVVGLPASLLRTKELRLTAAASHRERDFQKAGQLIDDGSVRVDDLIHKHFPLARVSAALEFATTNDTGRVVVTMGTDVNGAPA